MRAVDEGDEENFPLKYLQQRQGRLIGRFRFEYDYEIEHENDFSGFKLLRPTLNSYDEPLSLPKTNVKN